MSNELFTTEQFLKFVMDGKNGDTLLAVRDLHVKLYALKLVEISLDARFRGAKTRAKLGQLIAEMRAEFEGGKY